VAPSACCTSCSTLRPPGPVPVSVRTSTPRASASARARGEIRTRASGPAAVETPPAVEAPPAAGAPEAEGAAEADGGACREPAAAPSRDPEGRAAVTASPASPMSAIGVATGAVVLDDFADFELLPHAVSTDSATTTAAMVFFTGG